MSEKKLKSEIRKSYLLNKYVIITPGRAKRPRDVKEETIIKRTSDCPFCFNNIDKSNIVDSIKNKEGYWDVVSIKNIFPAVTLDNDKAYGSQEVIIETQDHTTELAELSKNHIKKVLKMYAKRTKELARNDKIDYVLCFKNQGSKAGASIIHAHSQIFATKILPSDINEELYLANDYKTKNNSCVYCDTISKELKSDRKVFEDDYIAAFTPYASEYHYEVWIFPKRHTDNISTLNKEELNSISTAMKLILEKLHSLGLSFNYFMHQAVSNKDQHFYIKIQPRDSVWAGVELGSGLVINSVPPEDAAEFYRE